MGNNFGSMTKDLKKGGKFILAAAAYDGYLSFSSAGTNTDRWNRFVDSLKDQGSDIKKMEEITADVIIEYGKFLADKVSNRKMAIATAQNYVSAINTVMYLATEGRWGAISPTKDCGIPHRKFVRTVIPASTDQAATEKCILTICAEQGETAGTIVSASVELGLRPREVSLENFKTLLAEAKKKGSVTIYRGTKGKRKRIVPITSKQQLDVLTKAAELQGERSSLMPANKNWREWNEGGLRKIREAVKKDLKTTGLYDLRAGYACLRYQSLSGFKAPVFGGPRPSMQVDRAARNILAKELGHNRDVTNAYIGGKKK